MMNSNRPMNQKKNILSERQEPIGACQFGNVPMSFLSTLASVLNLKRGATTREAGVFPTSENPPVSCVDAALAEC